MALVDFLLYFVSLGLFTYLFLNFMNSRQKLKSPKLPPGPSSLSVLRNLPRMTKPYQFFSDLAKVYGPVISVKIGFTRMVVVSSPAMAKEVLQKSDASFCDRSPFIAMTVLGHHETTIAFSPPNAHWRDLKKICKNYLFSKVRLDATQGVRGKQVQRLLAHVQDCCNTGTPVNISLGIFSIYLNFIAKTFFSEDLDDPQFNIAKDFWELVAGTLDLAGISNVADYVPLLKLVDPQGIKRRTSARYEKGTRIFKEVIARRLNSKVGKVELNKHNDMLDVILNAVHENNTEVKESELPNILLELLVGGYDTTSIVIEWAMAELLNSPSKLEKAQAELAEVVGRGKPIEEDDIDRLPYLRAIMKETFRLHPPVPFLVPRKATTDVELSGFVVPKGTQVLVNVWSIGRDESVWKDANVFQPERFMDCDIDFKGRNIELTPFGAGRRMCPGLPIAQKMLHLILGSLLNSFNWKLEEGVRAENMNMDDKYGFTLGKAERLQAIPTNIL
ncbi:hypothetical protein Droror1_Dr00022715 [Drosera rotundifolia]